MGLAALTTGVLLTGLLGPASNAVGSSPTEEISAPARATSTAARITPAWSGSIDTRYRGVVNDSYKRRYAPHTNVRSGYAGLGCLLGSTSAKSHSATLASLNYVRALAGVAPVSFSSSRMNRQTLQAAVMMQANGRLSHDPLTSWLCYTLGGDEAAKKSNLALYYPEIGSGHAIDLYMDDRGTYNTPVGHRRWLLYPFTTVMGNGTTKNANAIMVIGPTSSTRPNPRWVRWPTQGYFPRPLEPVGRWSLTSGYRSDSFSRSWVAMWKNGNRIYPRKYAVKNGYGMPTIVWQLPSGVERTGTFKVKVGNICRSGAGCFSTTYTTKIFAPY